MKLTQFQIQEFSKYWFDLSKIVVASLVIKFFEPQAPTVSANSLFTIFVGLTFAMACVIFALRLSKEKKR